MSSASPPLQCHAALTCNTYTNVYKCPHEGIHASKPVYDYSCPAFQTSAAVWKHPGRTIFCLSFSSLISRFPLCLLLHFPPPLPLNPLTLSCAHRASRKQGGLCRLLSGFGFVSNRGLSANAQVQLIGIIKLVASSTRI